MKTFKNLEQLVNFPISSIINFVPTEEQIKLSDDYMQAIILKDPDLEETAKKALKESYDPKTKNMLAQFDAETHTQAVSLTAGVSSVIYDIFVSNYRVMPEAPLHKAKIINRIKKLEDLLNTKTDEISLNEENDLDKEVLDYLQSALEDDKKWSTVNFTVWFYDKQKQQKVLSSNHKGLDLFGKVLEELCKPFAQ